MSTFGSARGLEALDLQTRRLLLEDGERIAFDVAVLATGARGALGRLYRLGNA